MKVIICIKQVPVSTQIKLNSTNYTFDRDQTEGIMNTYDQFVLEEAIRIKEQNEGHITAVSMGVLSAEGVLKEALALGADRAVLLNDKAFAGSDTLATAYVLHKAIEKIKDYKLIICGQQSTDGETAQVGPSLGERLGISQATYVKEIIEIGGDYIICKKKADAGEMIIKLKLPALITLTKEINRPRLPTIRGTLKARKKYIEKWSIEDIHAEPQHCGLQGSPTQVVSTSNLVCSTKCEMIEAASATEQVEQLINKLFYK